MNEKQFTMDNTEGYGQAELDQMNEEFAELMQGVDENDWNYADIVKNMADRVGNRH